MKNLSKTILAVAVAGAITVGLAQQSQAVPVVGNINFGGSVTLNTSSAGTATGVTSWSGFGTGGKPQVQNRDGSFVGFVYCLPVSDTPRSGATHPSNGAHPREKTFAVLAKPMTLFKTI